MLDRIEDQIRERAPERPGSELIEALALARLKAGRAAYTGGVLDLVLALRRHPVVDDELVTELLEQAAETSDQSFSLLR